MPRKSKARRKLIQAAANLFWRKGYESTGVAEILDKAQIGSGSFYWFFRSKEDLLIAVLDDYLGQIDPVLAAPAYTASQDPVERIFLILAGYRQLLTENDYQLGCPIGNIVLELGDRYPEVRKKTEELFEGWRGMIRNCLHDASDRLPSGTDFDALSIFVLTVMEGGVMQARSHKDVSYYDASVQTLRDYFDHLINQHEKQEAKK